MKQFFVILIFASLSFTAFAQVEIKVKGVTTNLVFATRYSNLKDKALAQVKNGEVAVLNLKEIDTETMVLLGCNEDVYFLWLKPGETIEVDAQTGIIKGGNTKINKYLETWKKDFLWNKNSVLQNHFMYLVVRRDLEVHNMDEFFSPDFVDKLKADKKRQLEDVRLKKISNKNFVEYFNRFIECNYKYTLVNIPAIVTHSGKQEVPVAILKEITAFDMEQNDFINNYYKDDLINGYIRAHEELKSVEPTLTDYIFQKAKVFNNRDLREYYVLNELGKLIKRKESLYVKDLFDSSRSLITTEAGKKEFEELYAKQVPNVYDNKKVYPLKAYDLDNREITLDKFKGKYVYIDVWATWCGPCKQMTRHFVELAEKYKDKNIVFLSLSADKNSVESKWREYVNEHLGSNCITAWTKSGFNNAFVQYYKINSIPRFMLIDPDGNVFSNKFWTPNDPRVETLLKQLLTQ